MFELMLKIPADGTNTTVLPVEVGLCLWALQITTVCNYSIDLRKVVTVLDMYTVVL